MYLVNWHWIAGTACDASLYFLLFNPMYKKPMFYQLYHI